MKFTPIYDKDYYPMIVKLNEFREAVKKEESKLLRICVERNKGYNFVYDLDIFASEDKRQENLGVVERIIKTILWVAGGYKIYIAGDEYIYENIKSAYSKNGARAFDEKFMCRGMEVVKQKMKEIEGKKNAKDKADRPSAVEEDMLVTLEVCYEFYLRGFTFTRMDVMKSHAINFLPDEERNALIPPFTSVAGLVGGQGAEGGLVFGLLAVVKNSHGSLLDAFFV